MPPPDELLRALSDDAEVSVRVLSATQLTREAARRHGTSATASVAIARALMGAILLATEGQDGERVQLVVRGDGPLGRVTVTADSDGSVRGYVQHARTAAPLHGEQLGLAEAIGRGTLAVERNHPSWKQPYSGLVPIATGEIAQDLAHYLLESEQKPCAVALGVYLDPGGGIAAAGGYLIQALPGASEATLASFERRVSATANPSQLLHDGADPRDLLARLLGPTRDEPTRLVPRFFCPCSIERVRRAAVLLGADEIRDAIARDETLEVRCAFCADVYHVPPHELDTLLAEA